MRNVHIMLLGTLWAMSMSACTQPVDQSPMLKEDQSAMRKMILPTRNADGTVSRKIQYFTHEQAEKFKADTVKARKMAGELRAQGLAAAVEWDWSCHYTSAQLYTATYLQEDWCCLSGGGWGNVFDLCGTEWQSQSLRAGEYPGWITVDQQYSCYDSFQAYEDLYEYSCTNPFWLVRND